MVSRGGVRVGDLVVVGEQGVRKSEADGMCTCSAVQIVSTCTANDDVSAVFSSDGVIVRQP